MHFSSRQLPYLRNTGALLDKLSQFDGLVALESSNSEHENGRWSIIAACPIETISIHRPCEIEGAIESLEKIASKLPNIDSSLPFTGGIIGHTSYDLGIPGLGKSTTHYYPNQPLLIAGLYTWAFVFDHINKQCILVYLNHPEALPITRLIDLYSEQELSTPHKQFTLEGSFQPSWSKRTYQEKIHKIHEYILKGDCYQVNLAQRFSAKFSGDSIAAYKKIKEFAEVPFACFFQWGEFSFASASPEMFLSYEAGKVTTKPIKGTLPKLNNRTANKQQIDRLKNSKKDLAENLMIVDLLRNDLSKQAEHVRVEKLFDIETYPTVHHLVSTITGKIKPQNILRLFFDAFPGGSITGAPKKRAMEIISELEEAPRSFYCGSSFYLSSNDKFNSNILIRSFLFEDNIVTCWAGGGIVHDSEWEKEHQESLDKISKLMNSLY